VNDRIVLQACKRGAKKTPIESKRKAKKITGNIRLDAEELAIALELAQQERIEQDINNYSQRKAKAATMPGDRPFHTPTKE
jgi:hypothetical protein